MHTNKKQLPQQRFRSLNRDGTDNVARHHIKKSFFRDLYFHLLSITWPKFFLLLLAAYLSVNTIFGFLFFTLGQTALVGSVAQNDFAFFMECFFFSVQTISTIGYGHISPSSLTANVLVATEAFLGMISIALMTGLFFSRFSKPMAHIIFSDTALITDMRGKKSLVFRVANSRLNQISEASMKVICLISEITSEGISIRQQHDIKLVRDISLLFSASWTLVHVIDEKSPLHNLSSEDMRAGNLEIIAALAGFDETLSQVIHARSSYTCDEIVWNRHYADIMNTRDGKLHIDLEKISDLR